MMAMPQRRVLVLIVTALLLLALIAAGIHHYYTRQTATSRKIAEGAYSAASTEPSSHKSMAEVDSFTLWSDPGQRLRVVITFHLLDFPVRDPGKPGRQTETLEMNSDFSMRLLRYELENTNVSGDGALDCLVKYFSLDCESTFEGARGKGSIKYREATLRSSEPRLPCSTFPGSSQRWSPTASEMSDATHPSAR